MKKKSAFILMLILVLCGFFSPQAVAGVNFIVYTVYPEGSTDTIFFDNLSLSLSLENGAMESLTWNDNGYYTSTVAEVGSVCTRVTIRKGTSSLTNLIKEEYIRKSESFACKEVNYILLTIGTDLEAPLGIEVTDKQGQRIPGVNVQVAGETLKPYSTGCFHTLNKYEEKSYTMTVTSPGYETITDSVVTIGTGAVGVIKVQMKAVNASIIEVFENNEGNPGTRVGEANITVTGPNSFEESGKTNNDGVYQTTSLEDGEYTVSVSHPYYISLQKQMVITGGKQEQLQFLLDKQPPFKVTVKTVLPDGTPAFLKGIKIAVTNDNGFSIDGTTGDDGVYTLPYKLLDGTYIINTKSTTRYQGFNDTITVTSSSAQAHEMVMNIIPGFEITVYGLNFVTLKDAKVTISQNGLKIDEGTTNSNGKYRTAQDLPVGNYDITIEDKDYLPFTKEFTVKEGVFTTFFELTELSFATLALDSETKKPLKGVSFYAREEGVSESYDGFEYWGYSDHNGKIIVPFPDLVNKLYLIELSYFGYKNKTQNFILGPVESIKMDRIPGNIIEIQEELSNGDFIPVSGIKIEVFNIQNNLIASGTTNEVGKIQIANLDPGTYFIKTQNNSYINLDEDLVVTGNNQDFFFTVSRSAGHMISVYHKEKTGDAGAGLADVSISIKKAGESTTLPTGTTDDYGRYSTSTKLTNGEYLVTLEKANYFKVTDYSIVVTDATDRFVILMDTVYSIRGVVVQNWDQVDDQALANAYVMIRGEQYITDSEGKVTIPMKYGENPFEATHEDMKPLKDTLNIDEAFLKKTGDYKIKMSPKDDLMFQFEKITINNGAKVALHKEVQVRFLYKDGIPSHYRLSEDPEFNGAPWMEYTQSPYSYTFKDNESEIKTLYAQLKKGATESEIVSALIYYKTAPDKIAVTLTVNNGDDVVRKRNIVLNSIVDGGTPLFYSVAEDEKNIGNEWYPYAEEVTFELSEGNGTKHIYFAVHDGNEASETVQTVVYLDESVTVDYHGLDARLYPNPVTDYLYVQMDDEFAKVKVTIYSVTGKVYYSNEHTGPSFTLDLSAYPTGMLLVKLSNGERYAVKRLIKQ